MYLNQKYHIRRHSPFLMYHLGLLDIILLYILNVI